jgi:methylmalonyl-CoA/ethylmalonyl-CoA epimerase
MNNVTETTESQVHLDEIGQIAVTVRDLSKSKDFYQETLGIKHLFDAGTMSFFQCGGIRLMIGTSPEPMSPGATILYFRVADVRETYATLMAQGVAFTQKPHLVAKMSDHDLWMAFLKDPDGNPIGLMSELRP